MSGCGATGKAIVAECPIDGLLEPVALSPVVKGEDTSLALGRRTGEAVEANGRIRAGRDYVKAHCQALPTAKKGWQGFGR